MDTRIIVCGIVQNGDRIILGKKASARRPYPNVWHTPGGGVDDTNFAAKLIKQGDFNHRYFHRELQRELREELDIEVTKIRSIIPEFRSAPREVKTRNRRGEKTHYIFLEYLCEFRDGKLKAADDLVEVRWVKVKDLFRYKLTPPSQAMYKELQWIK